MFEYIQIDVINSGIGIDDNFKNKIFEEFTQADNNYSRQYEGTGLGLALTKKIVELHGGHINFESVKNDFTDFTFVLPNPLEAEISSINSEEAEKTLITVDAKTFFRNNNAKRNLYDRREVLRFFW